MNRINPPAIVREVGTLKEKGIQVQAMFGAMNRKTLETIRDIGKFLFDVRGQCQSEKVSWPDWLAENHVERRTTTRYMRIFLEWDLIEANWDKLSKLGLVECLNWIAEHYAEEEESETKSDREPGDDQDEPDEAPASDPPISSEDETSYGNQDDKPPSRDWTPPAPNGHATTEPAKPTKTEPMLCDRCKHNKSIGREVVKGCDMCKQLRPKPEPRQSKTVGDAQEPAGGGDDPKDAFGNSVPKGCRDVIFDPWIQDTIEFLAEWNAKLLEKRIGQDIVKRAKRIPWIMAKDADDGIHFMTQYGDQVISHLKENRPVAVCPSCKGKKCGDCRQSGVVPRTVYLKLTGTEK